MDAMLIDGFSLADQAKEAENIIQSHNTGGYS